MLKISSRNFLTGEELDQNELTSLLSLAAELKADRKKGKLSQVLSGKTLALLFEKPSLRTRFSFTVAMHELGGLAVECVSSNTKKEEPEDTARVLEGYCHAVMLRTHEHTILERMTQKSQIPIINGLSNTHHPCQALADLLTLKEAFGKLEGVKLAYIGDGNNMLHSLLLLAPYLGVHLRYACPEGYEPSAFIVKRAAARAKKGGGSIVASQDPESACKDANALYTDVWTSMGFEEQSKDRDAAFNGYQLNEDLLGKAAQGAIVMHCLPMVRGKEISETLVDHPGSALFRQSENRLHAQKALLLGLLGAQR